MTEKPMNFPRFDRGRTVSITMGERLPKNDDRPWEQPPFRKVRLYVGIKALSVK